jgi:hypothetical protein
MDGISYVSFMSAEAESTSVEDKATLAAFHGLQYICSADLVRPLPTPFGIRGRRIAITFK